MRIVVLLAAAWGLSRSMPAVGDGPGAARPGPPAIAGAGPRTAAHPARTTSSSRRGSARSWSSIAPGATGRRSRSRACGSTRAAALLKGNDGGPVVVPGRPEESPLVEAIRYDATIKMPPAGQAAGAGDRRPDRTGSRWASPGPNRRPGRRTSGAGVPDAAAIAAAAQAALGVPAGPGRDAPAGPRCATGPRDPLDRFILARLEAAGSSPVAAGRPADPDPPRHVRPDRAAADARGGRRLRGRPVARRLRPPGRPPAGLAALRRALGAALARRRPLRRHQGLRLLPGRRLPLGLHLPRLRHRARSTATCPTTGSSSSRSRPTGSRPSSTTRRAPAGGPGVPDRWAAGSWATSTT